MFGMPTDWRRKVGAQIPVTTCSHPSCCNPTNYRLCREHWRNGLDPMILIEPSSTATRWLDRFKKEFPELWKKSWRF